MRKIYASPRTENIERLIAVMAEHGIATKVTNRRAYAGSSFATFSYAKPGSSENWPSLWVVHSNDNARARQLMREMGLEQPTRYATELAEYRARKQRNRTPGYTAARFRMLAMAALVAAIAIYVVRIALPG